MGFFGAVFTIVFFSEPRKQFQLMNPLVYRLRLIEKIHEFLFPFFDYFLNNFFKMLFRAFSKFFSLQPPEDIIYFVSFAFAYIGFLPDFKIHSSSRNKFKESQIFLSYRLGYWHHFSF